MTNDERNPKSELRTIRRCKRENAFPDFLIRASFVPALRDHSSFVITTLVLTLVLGISRDCLGILVNAWHIPDNSSDLSFNMRNPEFEIGPNSTTTVYSGI